MSGVLDSWHRRRGGRSAPLGRGDEAASGPNWIVDYGERESQFDRQRQVGLVDRSWTGRLELVGEDRHRFLNGLVTCDVSEPKLPPGAARYGYFTDGKGRILSDVNVLALEDRLWLELPAGRQSVVRPQLEKYIVADRVDVRPLSDFVLLCLVGELASDRLATVVGMPLPVSSGTIRFGETNLFAQWHGRLGLPAVQLWVSSGIAEPVADDLVNRLGAVPVGNRQAEALRIQGGVPAWGVDFGDHNLPGEVAVEGAVDYDKGCYLGQEIVARMHYRGRPARELRVVEGTLHDGTVDPPEPGAQLSVAEDREAEGRVVGTLTSVALDAEKFTWRGLALISRAALEEPTLRTAEGETVRVMSKPLPAHEGETADPSKPG